MGRTIFSDQHRSTHCFGKARLPPSSLPPGARSRPSLALIKDAASHGKVIDVGGGTSVLVDRLLDAGYTVTVLDLSQAAPGDSGTNYNHHQLPIMPGSTLHVGRITGEPT